MLLHERQEALAMLVELTKEEAEVLESYAFRKACRLKESGLEDSKCYPLLMSAHRKLKKALEEMQKSVYKH